MRASGHHHCGGVAAVCAAIGLPLAQGAKLARALLLTASLALTVLAGHFPLAMVVVAACFLFGLLLAVLDGGGLSILLVTAAASLCAALLSLAQLAPTYQLTNLSVAQFRADYLGAGAACRPPRWSRWYGQLLPYLRAGAI